MKWSNKKIYVVLIMCAIIVISVCVSIESGLVGMTDEDQKPSNNSAAQNNTTIQPANFNLSKNLSIPSIGNLTYITYNISNSNYSNATANLTIKRLFGNISDDVYKYSNYETNGYDYWVPGGIYGIRSDYRIFYFNHSQPGIFSKGEIENNKSLYNSTQSNSISDNYIKLRIGQNFSLFTLESSVNSTVVTVNGEFIKGYKFTYSRRIRNITVDRFEAGYIRTIIAPDGTVLSFMMYMPTLTKDISRKPIEPSSVITIVDNNFSDYRPLLLAGYENYTLSMIQLSYGMSNGMLTIGWELSFASGSDGTKVSTVFTS